MRVIAFHGDGGTAAIMRRDMGNPTWVTDYWDWTELLDMANAVSGMGRVVLVGYSQGAAHVAWIARYVKNIVAAVIYESPDPGMRAVPGRFPALLVRNDYGLLKNWWIWKKRSRSIDAAEQAWRQSNRHCEAETGRGLHTRLVRGWPPIAHGWDRSLNTRIDNWIATHAN